MLCTMYMCVLVGVAVRLPDTNMLMIFFSSVFNFVMHLFSFWEHTNTSLGKPAGINQSRGDE